MEESKKTVSFTFRIDELLSQKIDFYAKKSNRTKSNFVLTLLTKAIKDLDDHILM